MTGNSPVALLDPPETQPQGERTRTSHRSTACDEPLQMILCDQEHEIVSAWIDAFLDYRNVVVRRCNITDIHTDARVVAIQLPREPEELNPFPAGSLVDQVLHAVQELGSMLHLEHQIRLETVILPTEDPHVPYLVSTPANSNAYKPMLSLLDTLVRFDRSNRGAIRSVAIPRLWTSESSLSPKEAAEEMRHALDHFRYSAPIG